MRAHSSSHKLELHIRVHSNSPKPERYIRVLSNSPKPELNVKVHSSSLKPRLYMRVHSNTPGNMASWSVPWCTLKTWARVWKGILGIQDLTKTQCENRENNKYLDGMRDLTAPRKRDSPKSGHGMRDFFTCLLGIREIVMTQIKVLPAKAAGVSFQIELIECVG